MRTDDDAYVILENLRYFLSGQDTNTPIYFGHKFKVIVQRGYFSGGPGIVLSKEALRRFSTDGLKRCPEVDPGVDDVNIGFCMQKLGKLKPFRYSRLSLFRIPRDSLKYFEIFVPRHIRFAELRKK